MNYYIADLHFGHNRILKFDHRPFFDMTEMEETIIFNWNTVVKPGDTVYILGDFCWRKADEWLRIIRRLKGNKVLIEGNHDLKQYPSELRKHFDDIKEYKEVKDDGYRDVGRKVILSHYPIPFFNRSNGPNHYMLCGHVHTTAENELLEKWIRELKSSTDPHLSHCGQIYNVGAMMPWIGYTPRTLDEIIRRRAAWEAERRDSK